MSSGAFHAGLVESLWRTVIELLTGIKDAVAGVKVLANSEKFVKFLRSLKPMQKFNINFLEKNTGNEIEIEGLADNAWNFYAPDSPYSNRALIALE